MDDQHPKILVIRRRYVGDLVLTGPVLKNLRAHMPQARITLLVDEKYQDVHSRSPEINEVIDIPQRRKECVAAYLLRWSGFLMRLRTRRFDVVYDISPNTRSACLTYFTGARKRVSFWEEDSSHWWHRLYNVHTTWADAERHSIHIVDLYLKPLLADNVPIVTHSITMTLHPDDVAVARTLIQQVLPVRRGPLVAVHPGARQARRCWPPERFAAVCDDIQSRLKGQVLLLSGPGEATTVQAIESAAATGVAVLDQKLTVPQLTAILHEADLYLGHDSGPMHLAAAVGTPVVALFGAQSPGLWRPYGDGHLVLRPPMPCVDCPFPDVCRPPDPEQTLCVRRLTVDEVISAVERQLMPTRA